MALLDPVMQPLLAMNPFLAIFLVSFILSVLITIIYKLLTDQELMKTLKADMKIAQKEMKKLKEHPEKMLKAQQKAMDKNMKYMMQSMKPTLVTIIPVLLIFGWLNGHFAFEPIMPGDEFTIDVELGKDVFGNISVELPAIDNSIELLEKESSKSIDAREISYKFNALSAGEWSMAFTVNGIRYPFTVVIDDTLYGEPEFTSFEGKAVKKISVNYEKKIVLNLFGWKMGWLITYIILSIVFSIGLRKLLKLH